LKTVRPGLVYVCRDMPVVDHGLINRIAERAEETELGGRLPRAIP